MPTSGDRKQGKSDFLANGEVFFLDLLSHRRPHLHLFFQTEFIRWLGYNLMQRYINNFFSGISGKELLQR